MGRILGSIIVLLSCIILMAGTSQAKTPKEVYLRDGGIVECQKVWQANGKVMVLVNRDILVDFSRDEVDLQKTFAKKSVKGVKKGKIRKKAASKPGAVMPQPASQPRAKPAKVAATAQNTRITPTAKPAPPTVKPVSPASPQTATPAAKSAASTAKPTPPVAKPAPPASPPPAAAPAAPQAAPKAVKPAPSAAVQPTVVKPAVQGTATSAKKPAPSAAAPPARTTLPAAKPPTPPKSFLAENMVNLALVALLVILVAGYMVYKKRQ